jgi:hypothetical protein
VVAVSSRHDDIAAFFAANATALERTVERHVIASQAIVEDACSIAWGKLLRRADIHLGSHGFWWLYRVTVCEVWRLSNDARRERSIDPDTEFSELVGLDNVADLAERRQTLRALDELPGARRGSSCCTAAGSPTVRSRA